MRLNYLIIALLGSLLLSGCASKTGNQFLEKMSKEEIDAKLVKGQTTKEEVVKLFGEPVAVTLSSDNTETYTYTFSHGKWKAINYVPYANLAYSGTNNKVKTLAVLFGANAKVLSHSFANARTETKTGAFQ